MRIKYKVWDKVNREWNNNVFVSGCGKILLGDIHDECRFVACIYVGQIDQNGTRIFCGDILEFPGDDFSTGETERMEVYYDKDCAHFGLRFWTIYGGEGHTGQHECLCGYVKRGAVVIGNINENPELICE